MHMKGQMTATGPEPTVPAERPRRRARFVWRTLAFGILVFLFGFGVFSSHIGRLATPATPDGADGIIVLTGGQARIDAAVDLLKAGKGKRLLISGVNPSASVEDIQRITGADARLMGCCIDIDRIAGDTVGNAIMSARWLNDNAYSSAILVTNNYHMPRSLLEMRRFGAGTAIQPYPVVNTRIDRGEWLLNPDALRVLFTEYAKYLAAVARDAIDGPDTGLAAVETAAAN
jgi:uncharacterized SAM-binding protein YcdF (DUF218 family)